MNIERMLKGIEILEHWQEEKSPEIDGFNMNFWFVKNICGTDACAVGTFATHPWFKEQGLSLTLPSCVMDDSSEAEPAYDGYRGFIAVAKFFDITAHEVQKIFFTTGSGHSIILGGYKYVPLVSPQQVANRMRASVIAHEAVKQPLSNELVEV